MVNQVYDFLTPALYSFDPLLIDVSGGGARLKIANAPGKVFSQDFASSAGFTFDPAKTEFTGGLMRQISQRIAGATFGATFTAGENAAWGNGVLTGALAGGAAVVGGKLVLTGATGKKSTYAAAGNVDSAIQAGCIRFKYTPNYPNIPTQDLGIFAISQAGNQVGNCIQLIAVNGSPNHYLQIYGASGGTPAVSITINFGFTAGVEYEIEINYDLTAGATRVFKNGVQVGATSTATATRSSAIGYFVLGSSYDGRRSDFTLDDFVVFTAVQHTANYTPGYTLPESDYFADTVTLPAFIYPWAESLQAFTGFSVTGSGIQHYCLNGKAWSGTAWADVTPTYANTNTAAEVIANIGTLPASDTLQIKILWDSKNTMAAMDDLSVQYTARQYPVSNPTIYPYQALTADALSAFLATIAATPPDGIKFVIQKDGTNKWYSGTSWATSAGYAESNTAAEIIANIGSLSVSSGAVIRLICYLHSDTGFSTPEISEAEMIYSFWAGAAPDPRKSTVWGYIMLGGAPAAGVRIEISLIGPAYYGDIMESVGPKIVFTDQAGYWEAELIPTATLTPTRKYRFEFTGWGIIRNELKTVPAIDTNYADLV